MRIRAALKVPVLIGVILTFATVSYSQQNPAGAELEVLHIRGPVYAIFGAGGNITASVGPDGMTVAS